MSISEKVVSFLFPFFPFISVAVPNDRVIDRPSRQATDVYTNEQSNGVMFSLYAVVTAGEGGRPFHCRQKARKTSFRLLLLLLLFRLLRSVYFL